MTYREAIEFLYSLRWFGTKLGLTHTLRLAELAGNPHEKLRFIHVAGTNGKGSTCAMLESVYRRAGLKVGLFTSPHLVTFGERIQVDRQLLKEKETIALLEEIRPLLNTFRTDEHPTFFEVVVVMGLVHFLRAGCDLVVLETGLGGRLDATNIITPLVSVITNIQFDHQKWLGETLSSIAVEKAGIIKTNVPCVTGANEPEALNVIQATAHSRRSPLKLVAPEAAQQGLLESFKLPLLGEHQRMNAAVALATIDTLQPRLHVKETQILEGLSNVYWPGRLQLIHEGAGRKVLLDGAHNWGGAQVLAAALKNHFPGERPTLILGVLHDKDWQHMCEILAPLGRRIVTVPVASERAAEPHALGEACRRANPHVSLTEAASLREAFEQTAHDPFVTVTGSLYLVGEALELLKVSVATSSERHLNEWGEPSSRAKN